MPQLIPAAASVEGSVTSKSSVQADLPCLPTILPDSGAPGLISPVIFYNLTLGVIGSFQYFVPAMLIGGLNGDPQRSLLFFPLHFYREAFVFSEMGYASVLALLIFAITMLATALLFFVVQRRVYYAGGE